MMHKHNTCLFTCCLLLFNEYGKKQNVDKQMFLWHFPRLFVEEKDMIIGQLAVSQNLLLIYT